MYTAAAWPPASLPTKSQFFSTKSHGANHLFDRVIIQGQGWIIEKAQQAIPVIQRIMESLPQKTFKQHATFPFQKPFEQRSQQRPGMVLAQGQALRIESPLHRYLSLNEIEFADDLQGFGRFRLAGFKGVEKLASNMNPAAAQVAQGVFKGIIPPIRIANNVPLITPETSPVRPGSLSPQPRHSFAVSTGHSPVSRSE